MAFPSQVSSSVSPQASLESHVFNVAVLPQTPKAPQLSLGSSLHMAVSDNTTHMAGVGMGKKQIRRATGLGGADNTHEKLKNSVLKVVNVQTGKERGKEKQHQCFMQFLPFPEKPGGMAREKNCGLDHNERGLPVVPL